MCIGEEFAKMLLLHYSAHIVKNFEIGLNDEVDFKGECGITLTPPDYHLTFKRLNKSD